MMVILTKTILLASSNKMTPVTFKLSLVSQKEFLSLLFHLSLDIKEKGKVNWIF